MFGLHVVNQRKNQILLRKISWLDYGHRGMQVWYPSLGVDPFMQEDFLQRMSFSACREFPFFEPTPQAQTILHCLLRHLIQAKCSVLNYAKNSSLSEKTTIFLEIFWSILMWLSVLQEKLMVDIGRICALLLGDQQSSLRNASNVGPRTAVCYTLVIPNLEGPAVSHQ
ncbi:uncharacterized protein LOC133715394 [Rosa rugosa]|uniref:uncharacterized protein LOC133715394 n=1 Tax=Rosa rugosa TaxID=74645 RepID=UPI002B405B0B|nr:uncharacterized protein LOC133715394 [Rosa rugosa]